MFFLLCYRNIKEQSPTFANSCRADLKKLTPPSTKATALGRARPAGADGHSVLCREHGFEEGWPQTRAEEQGGAELGSHPPLPLVSLGRGATLASPMPQGKQCAPLYAIHLPQPLRPFPMAGVSAQDKWRQGEPKGAPLQGTLVWVEDVESGHQAVPSFQMPGTALSQSPLGGRKEGNPSPLHHKAAPGTCCWGQE